jgi:hypothetical protein
MNFNFLKDKKNSWLFALFLSLFAGLAMAGTGGTEFNGMETMVTGWIEGGLGLTVTLVGLGVGVGSFIFTQKLGPALVPAFGGIALGQVVVPLVGSMFTALI